MSAAPVILESNGSQATLSITGDVTRARVGEIDEFFERARLRHPAIIRVDLRGVDSVDRPTLHLFVHWQHVADRTGFHVLFVRAHDRVYRKVRAAGLQCVLTVERG